MKKFLYILLISNSIQSIPIKLPSIDDYLLKAGVEESAAFYSPDIKEGEYWELHNRGYEIYEDFLKRIFLGTVFQFYTYILIGYDMNYNYTQFKDYSLKPKSYDLRKFGVLAKDLLSKPLKDIKEIAENDKLWAGIQTAIDNLKQNQLLLDLGIAFERQKIVVEKLEQLLRKNPSEEIQRNLLEIDRIDIDILNMIYYFMKESYEEFKSKLAKTATVDEAIRATDFLATFKPEFINWPYYYDIITQLNRLKQPIKLEDCLR